MNIFQKISSLFNKKSFGENSLWIPISGGSTNTTNPLYNNKNWVFVAVDKVAGAASSVRLKVMKTKNDEEDEEIFSGPLADFLYKPHPQLTGKDFTYLTFAYKELCGNAYWKKMEGNKVMPLDPTKVKPVIKDGVLVNYKYTNGTRVEILEIDDVLHDKYPDPASPFFGVGTLRKIDAWVDTDTYATEFNKAFFLNGATFGGFIETDETSAERIKLIREGFIKNHTGSQNAHKTGILPKGAKWTQNAGSMTDMQFSEMDARYRDKILSAFGVPKAVAGIVDDVNRANAEASEYVFSKYTVKPKMDRFVDFLNEYVVPMFDKSGQVYISYDDFIPENMDIKLREREIALNRQPYKTINEVRAETGLSPITGGDVVFGNPFVAPVGSPIKSLPKPKRVKKDNIGDIVKKAVQAVVANKEITQPIDKVLMKHKQFVSRVEAHQMIVAKKVQDFNVKQRNEVIQRLKQITKAVTKGDLFDMDTEVGVMIDFMTPVLGQLFKEQLVDEWGDYEFSGLPDTTDSRLNKIIGREAKRLAKSYNDTTANLLKDAINEGIREGDTIPKIAERVSAVYEFSDSYRALSVAHTETFYIANEANREAYRQSGVVEEIKWVTAEDELTCEFCGPLNNKTIDIKENFYDKGQTVSGNAGGKLPMDYRAMDNPPLHPNCRCFIQAVVKDIGELSVKPSNIKDMDKEDEEFIDDLTNLLDL